MFENVKYKHNVLGGQDVFNIGICDDGELICTAIEEMILAYAKEMNYDVDTKVWFHGEGLQKYLAQGNHLDILFLDIELISTTGMEVGSYIRNHLDNIGMQIIYISGKASYAQHLFKTQPLDFLVKPITQNMINNVLDTAIRVIKRKKVRFEFQQGKDYYYVPLGDIVYFNSEGRKVKIVTSETTFEFYGKLKDVTKQLSENFITIHKSYIVNKEYIFRYTYEMVELIDGTMLTISPANRKQIRERVLREE